MAKPEQTEKATPKRRHEARQRGQVPRSSDLAGAVIFLAVVLTLHALFTPMMGGLQDSAIAYFSHIADHGDLNYRSISILFMEASSGIGWVVLITFAMAVIAGIVANVLQFGFVLTPVPFKWSFAKLNPINGFKNIFSKRIFVNLGKQLLKLSAVAIIIYTTLASNFWVFANVGQTNPAGVIQMTFGVIYSIGWKFGLCLVVIGILDYVYERWQLEENLKMTKQEVKDEWKQSEGNPEAKAALKKRQREFARRRMMQAVPRATVVVTNPTHFAVALEWDELKMDAPVIIAKGADLLAKRIRDIAREHGIPIMENPPLARTLYERVELDHPIPPNLYAAVAQVIAFVYKLKRKTIA
ncbi:MAG TPA: flagellar biosynthesis protein FlhB [Candidatus Acidoferrales bacterium]|nr:flagellar biosynthesis protein FlhB [Candidatus Acidoferrales bacterium]HTX57804.1 flagellar biosynthesis protein FlhB [Candidatus Acidoferrales bacterium]